jgi:amidohydrolase
MTQIDFKAQAQAMRDELIARRRDFHRHPELAFEEVRTAGIVAQELNNLGMEVQTGVGKTGVVAILEGAHDGPTVLMRADMDALPINEENQTEFTSGTSGKMHACGHDGHTAIMLGVAKLLSGYRDQMAGRIKFVFQPAEEVGRGALAMVNDGALTSPRPDVTLGLHLWNSMSVGKVGLTSGSAMAGASIFTVNITGKGAHAASAHQGIDPVVAASHIVTALQTIVSRNVDALETAVVSVTYIRAGEAYNVVPQTAELRGTFRVFTHEMRDLVGSRIQSIVENVARALGCEATVEIQHLTKPVINNPEVTERVKQVFTPILGADAIELTNRTMGSEDVSEFMDDIPGLYFFLGAKDETAEAYYGHHHPRFSIDENALPLGVELLSAAAAEYVIPKG